MLSTKTKGILCVFFAAFLYSFGGLCVKLIPWSGLSINSARNIISLIVLGVYLFFTRHRLRFHRYILVGALCVFGSNVLFTVSTKLTTAANAIVLQFTAPIFVLILSMIFWKRKPKFLDVATCFLVLSGVLCFFLDSLELGGLMGNILALFSGLAYAGVFLLNDMPDSDPISSVFWGDLISVIIGLPFLLQETVFTPTAIFSVTFMGAFQVAVAYILMCIGLRTTPAVTASLISGIEPIMNPILVALFYGEAVGPMALLGSVIVIGSVIGYNILKSRKQES